MRILLATLNVSNHFARARWKEEGYEKPSLKEFIGKYVGQDYYVRFENSHPSVNQEINIPATPTFRYEIDGNNNQWGIWMYGLQNGNKTKDKYAAESNNVFILEFNDKSKVLYVNEWNSSKFDDLVLKLIEIYGEHAIEIEKLVSDGWKKRNEKTKEKYDADQYTHKKEYEESLKYFNDKGFAHFDQIVSSVSHKFIKSGRRQMAASKVWMKLGYLAIDDSTGTIDAQGHTAVAFTSSIINIVDSYEYNSLQKQKWDRNEFNNTRKDLQKATNTDDIDTAFNSLQTIIRRNGFPLDSSLPDNKQIQKYTDEIIKKAREFMTDDEIHGLADFVGPGNYIKPLKDTIKSRL